MSERQPLLEGDSVPTHGSAIKSTKKIPPGPLDLSRNARYAILCGIWIANFLGALNMTLVPTMLASISGDFNKSHMASWLGTSYLLATCTFTPLYGRLCNVLGRRGANQVAVLFTAAGTLACGLSTSMEMLIVARFIGGIGGGGIFTTAGIITSDMYSLRDRGLTQGVASIFAGMGQGMGGPFGGFVSDWLGWRWAFLLQLPVFLLSFVLTSINLNYATPGRGKSTKDILRRIDYGGSASLLLSVGSCLMFLSTRYNEGREAMDPWVVAPLVLSVFFFVAFIAIELWIAPEPVLAPGMLKMKIPVLCGISNFLVATANFSITYFFPLFFQTVILDSASTAGAHLIPNSISMPLGSLFAGYMIHRTGKFKTLTLTFGAFPSIATYLIRKMDEVSPPYQLWLSIIPLGFGNAVVLQTMLIALLANLPDSAMAVATGFGQLWRGLGQVGGVAVSSAIFQSVLDRELRARITGPDAAEIVRTIRQNARLVISLEPHLQREARSSYAVALKAVFTFAMCSAVLAYIVRLPIPDKSLDREVPKRKLSTTTLQEGAAERPPTMSRRFADTSALSQSPLDSGDESGPEDTEGQRTLPVRRLSGYGSADGWLDLERNIRTR